MTIHDRFANSLVVRFNVEAEARPIFGSSLEIPRLRPRSRPPSPSAPQAPSPPARPPDAAGAPATAADAANAPDDADAGGAEGGHSGPSFYPTPRRRGRPARAAHTPGPQGVAEGRTTGVRPGERRGNGQFS